MWRVHFGAPLILLGLLWLHWLIEILRAYHAGTLALWAP